MYDSRSTRNRAKSTMTLVIRGALCLIVVLCLAAGIACKKPLGPKTRPMQTHRFPVDVTLTRNSMGWEHFTPSDYYNPAVTSRIEIWVRAQYNKSDLSPGVYSWLRVTFADSAGHFSNTFQPYDYEMARYDTLYCSAPITGGDTTVTAYLGTVETVHTLAGGPGSGYSVLLWLAAGIPDAVSDEACTADTAVAADDTVHVSEIIYKVLPLF